MKRRKDISKVKVIEEAEKQEKERVEAALEKEKIIEEQRESEEREAEIENLILELNNNHADIEIAKNENYIIKIDGYGHEGEGVGKINNFTVFVKGAIKDETVKIKLIKVSKTYGIGKLLDVILPSKYRTEPICPIYKRCGGCNLQHISYEEQLNFKTQRVKDVMKRVGKIEGLKVHNTMGMDFPYNYRNKVQLPVGNNDGNIVVGFYAPRSHEIINMDHCYIQSKIGDKVVKLLKEWMKEYKLTPYDEKSHSGVVRHIMIREGFKTKEVMVVIVTNGEKLPNIKPLIKSLREEILNLKSIIQNVNRDKTNVILGNKSITLWGTDTISDYIGEFRFNISPLSFFQVNPVQTEMLYKKALEYASLTGNEIVFDAYCGTGTISLFLSRRAKMVYGIEIIPEAIENANENKVNNDVNNVEFIVGKSEEEIPKLIEGGIHPDVIMLDPPRKGCEESLLHAIAGVKPKRIVYVSCDPATLARDLKVLEELGYKAVELQPVDMFSQGHHVECVVLIERKSM
ncbi:23S rRNA (uracil(1939)-C(5))-methyltransferase RlmD [Clostridium sp.]|uniref:23S rRNA (uracil(1939)-C(5))-methyltransferase RlmD n=1 Tax=Clostridium sp. TaxID=1506 RepID=UPI003216A47E